MSRKQNEVPRDDSEKYRSSSAIRRMQKDDAAGSGSPVSPLSRALVGPGQDNNEVVQAVESHALALVLSRQSQRLAAKVIEIRKAPM